MKKRKPIVKQMAILNNPELAALYLTDEYIQYDWKKQE